MNLYYIEKNSISTLFGNNRLHIPPIQRKYSWNKEKAETLWDDIFSFINDDERDFYLFHTVILVRTEGKMEVLDGQQRITTMSALASAVIDKMESSNFQDKFRLEAENYRQTFLKKEGGDPVVTTYYDHDRRILEWIQKPEEDRGRNYVRHRLAKNYHLFKTLISDLIDEKGEEEGLEITKKMMNALCNKSFLSVATFQTIPEAIHAFDTTNNRGQELTLTDLMRYWMLSNAARVGRDLKEDMQTQWEIISNNIESETDLSDFVMRFWTAKLGKKYAKSKLVSYLSSEIPTNYRERASLTELSRELKDASVHYMSLIQPASSDPNATRLKFLKAAGSKQNLTALLAGKIMDFTDNQMRRLIVICECVFSWYQLVCNRAGTALYHRYCEWAKLILDSTDFDATLDSIASDVKVFFTEKGLVQDTLKREFLRTTFDSNNQAKFLLSHFENQLRDDMQIESPRKVHLEHILPQNPSPGEWVQWGDEDADLYKSRLGNMCLLLASDNISVSNLGFDTKKQAYSRSSLLLTRSLVESENWSVEDVKNRQESFFPMMLEIWNVDNL